MFLPYPVYELNVWAPTISMASYSLILSHIKQETIISGQVKKRISSWNILLCKFSKFEINKI